MLMKMNHFATADKGEQLMHVSARWHCSSMKNTFVFTSELNVTGLVTAF